METKRKNALKTPVVFIIFNRPKQTKLVFEKIAQIRPSKLFIIADGPRSTKLTDDVQVKQTREVVNNITWPCKVYRKYSNKNLGCKISVSTGLDWVFNQVDKAIILEDDCIPCPSFFYFCEALLTKYVKNLRVMHISGTALLHATPNNKDLNRPDTSYYFSRIPSVWGWATWKRAWMKYDVNMKTWPKRNFKILTANLYDRRAQSFMNKRFEAVFKGKIDTWDYQWIYSLWCNHGYAISPYNNYIQNIGFNNQATHTKFETRFSNLPINKLELTNLIKHPKKIVINKLNDMTILNSMYPESLIVDIIKKKLLYLKKLLYPH